MITIERLIKSEVDYKAALSRIEHLMTAPRNGDVADELELLSTLAELYEETHHRIMPPDPIEAIKFRMEQAGLKQIDLVPIMGSRAKVSELLSGKRPLTLAIIRDLNEKLGIPTSVLVPKRTTPDMGEVREPERFPWDQIIARKWLYPTFRGTVDEARKRCAQLAQHLLRNLQSPDIQAAMFRRNVRAARVDSYALLAWTANLVNVAKTMAPPVQYRPKIVDDTFMQKLVSFSFLEQGPRLAREFLFKNGIILVLEPHLPKTYVDGAVTVLDDGTPVIGLSLRHNRIDNFWFCLFHEIAHLRLHLAERQHEWYVDDLDVADTSKHEQEADRWAQDKLIPPDAWSRLRHYTSAEEVEEAAQELQISPAIIAGRIRYDRKNYKLFTRLIGQRELHRIFGLE